VRLRAAPVGRSPRQGARSPWRAVKWALFLAQQQKTLAVEAMREVSRAEDGDGPRSSGECRLSRRSLPQRSSPPRRIGGLPLPREPDFSIVVLSEPAADRFPDAQLDPPLESPVQRGTRSIFPWDRLPLTARVQDVEDTVENPTRRRPRAPAGRPKFLDGKQDRDPVPQLIGQLPDRRCRSSPHSLAVSATPPLHSVIRHDAKRPRTTWRGGDPALHHLRDRL
jgi:hypothetical protein